MPLRDIIGHRRLTTLLARAIERESLPPTLLFAGPAGVGKWAVARAVDPPLNKFLAALALHHENFRPFMLGILQLSGIAYYVAITYFFLLCATKVLEARRWR